MNICIRNIILNLIYRLFVCINKQEQIVLYQGSGKADAFENISTISKYFRKQKLEHSVIYRPNKVLGYLSILWSISKAKIFIFDSQNPGAYINKTNTVFINCWHAVGAYKTLGFDAIPENLREKKEEKRVERVFSGIDYWICSSKLQADIYAKSTKIDRKKFLDIGIPRTDLLFTQRDKNYKKPKIVLYAPTFRGRQQREVPKPFDLEKIKDPLLNGLIFAYRGHPTSGKSDIHEGWLDFSCMTYLELIKKTDILITDYSSLIFDFYLADKEIILYTPDLDEYKFYDHKLYFMPEELNINNTCKDYEGLIKCIKSSIMSRGKYSNKYRLLTNSCKGNSCEKLYRLVLDYINE